ncbi:MAG: 50S ribosomal protein L30 [Acidiferrobacterales bacterium]|nr:50S ribosomal protein L30 [Acidiferrobacterales bacterium]
MGDSNSRKLRVKLIRSINGRLKSHKACVHGLGLRRINQIRELEDTPQVRGMVSKVSYMVECEEID